MMKSFHLVLSVLVFIAATAAVSVGASPDAHALLSPLGFSVIPPVQFPPADFDVVGARVDLIWGKHRSVYGFDLGVIGNMTMIGMGGIQVAGVFNFNRGVATAVGTQFAGVANVNVDKITVVGIQFAGALNQNYAESRVVGLQLATFANLCSHTNIYGLQAGLWNEANNVYGFQIGLFNSARALHGIQIGILNANMTGPFAYSPFLNVGF
jgi:hypothetical protein